MMFCIANGFCRSAFSFSLGGAYILNLKKIIIYLHFTTFSHFTIIITMENFADISGDIMINGKNCILIVDDEQKIVRALGDYFTANNYCVLKAYDGEEALDVFYKNISEIDLIILDVMMPKLNGFDVLKTLREQSYLVPIIMLTAKSEEYDQIKGLNFGSDDYISKPISPTLLFARTEAVLRRVKKNHNTDLVAGNLRVSRITYTVSDCDKTVDLTKREFDLLCYLMMNEKIILSREQILNAVWGYSYEGDTRTVDTHIKQLRSKLISADYIKTVYKVGYKFECEEDKQ